MVVRAVAAKEVALGGNTRCVRVDAFPDSSLVCSGAATGLALPDGIGSSDTIAVALDGDRKLMDLHQF